VGNLQNKSFWYEQVHWKVSELCFLGGSLVGWLAGVACNITVRLANSGKMPVLAFPSYLALGQTATHFSVFEQSAKLPFLWDRLWVGTWIISIGDLLMLIGWILFVTIGAVILIKKYGETKKLCSHSPNSGH
jgi:hypothetical protein